MTKQIVKNNMNKFNPKFTKFLEDNKEIGLIEVAWSLFWRIYLVTLGFLFVVGFLQAL